MHKINSIHSKMLAGNYSFRVHCPPLFSFDLIRMWFIRRYLRLWFRFVSVYFSIWSIFSAFLPQKNHLTYRSESVRYTLLYILLCHWPYGLCNACIHSLYSLPVWTSSVGSNLNIFHLKNTWMDVVVVEWQFQFR